MISYVGAEEQAFGAVVDYPLDDMFFFGEDLGDLNELKSVKPRRSPQDDSIKVFFWGFVIYKDVLSAANRKDPTVRYHRRV